MTRRGFTLIEVIVAMVVAGLAVSTAAAIFATATDAVRQMAERSEVRMREANGRQVLAELLAGLESDPDGDARFEGASDRMRFRTRYWISSGWPEPFEVLVSVAGGSITVNLPDGGRTTVLDSVSEAAFDYLLTRGADSPWLAEWSSESTMPLAIRLRARRTRERTDTLVFLIGERA